MRPWTDRYSHLHPRALIRNLRRRSERRSWAESYSGDDYNWNIYTKEYSTELESISQRYSPQLEPGDYEFVESSLVQRKSKLPLHPNHRLLYETLLQLKPSSVVEAGCGGGDHLHNLRVLEPGLQIAGVDRSPEQLELLKVRAPAIFPDTRVFDLTLPFSSHLPQADIAFTQAVLMHIHTGHGHLVALANLFRLARRQVILMENWTRHPFFDDIRRLHEEGMIAWPALNIYVRRSPELGNRPHLMVVSKDTLEYEPLSRYAILTG